MKFLHLNEMFTEHLGDTAADLLQTLAVSLASFLFKHVMFFFFSLKSVLIGKMLLIYFAGKVVCMEISNVFDSTMQKSSIEEVYLLYRYSNRNAYRVPKTIRLSRSLELESIS